MELALKDKVAIVTGANRGIGAGVARQLAREGMRIALVARGQERLEQTADDVRRHSGTPILVLPCDLKVNESAMRAVDRTIAEFGRLDLLVNNAGATRRGAIVNIVGVGAWTGIGEFTIGGTVNAGLMNFTKAMADIGKRDGVRVCAVNPGRIQTDRLERNIQRIARESGLDTRQAAELLLKECGINRFGSPDEIGQAVAFLASSAASSFAQGAILDVDGGETRAI